MDFNLTHGTAVLARTPRVLDALLRGLPDAWTRANEGEGTWSPYDVVGHLIHGERADWIPRVRMILDHGESKTFAPFDREAMKREPKDRTLAQLLDEFAALRERSLADLAACGLTPADFAKTGMHPKFGRVTLGQLLATWVAHDLGHLVQVSRTMGSQYGEAIGPWREFLTNVARPPR